MREPLHGWIALPFWNEGEGRVRALWRVLVPIVGTLAAILAGQMLFVAGGEAATAVGVAAAATTTVLLVVALAWGCARYLDRRPPADYGFTSAGTPMWWRDCLGGVTIGLAMPGLWLAIMLLAGWAEVEAVLSPGTYGIAALVGIAMFGVQYVAVAIYEELVFRGMLLTNLAEWGRKYASRPAAIAVAVILGGTIFGVLHGSQAAQYAALPAPVALAGTWVSLGILLGVAFVTTGSLALPVGIHFGVNFGINNVFGTLSTPDHVAPAVLRLAVDGPASIVGVGGVLQMVTIGVGYLLVALWVLGRDDSLALQHDVARWTPAE